MVCLAIVAALVQEPSIWYQKDLSGRVLTVEGRYFLATPPEHVIGVDARWLAWSADGRYLAIQGVLPKARKQGWLREVLNPTLATMVWGIWDSETNRYKEIMRSNETVDLGHLSLVGRSGGGFLSTPRGDVSSLYWVDAIPGNPPKLIGEVPLGFGILPSPVKDQGIIVNRDRTETLLLYRSGFVPGPKLPKGSMLNRWDAGGSKLTFGTQGDPRGKTLKFIDLDTREVGTSSNLQFWEPTSLPVFSREIGEETKRLILLGLDEEDTKRGTLLAEGVEYSVMAETRDAIAYESNGSVFATFIREISKSDFANMEELAEVRRTLEQANGAIGIIRELAREADWTLGPPDDVMTKIAGVEGGPDLARQLMLTYKGELKIPPGSPSVELGYVQGKTGRAVIYSNGSVKWQKGSR
ncbi:MAG TPA: hypothetical protein PKA27_09120 [Fimbriimonadaceae bacterium]|nr:hypothetical protein [Fimbriimonadaceae bacterium]